ncbi:putative sulfate permease C3H7.02 [Psilocybe cubensis]|uniref:STAS domain-containing protein n=2 Tax=Psilocybe cubensis TaxID=181762 RepID=A0A8H7Y4J2_PSICU|nr:putative sulfate permease C3H7.02 [Psilocybe cubensis]KAH9483746.1 putative sulfate permease C3H7.02 [Psilocybe cubensis]
MSIEAAKRYGKRIIGYPETTVPVASSIEYVTSSFNNPTSRIKTYVISLFPILSWIGKYNLGWLTGDVIAGITVGMVVVPQGMSYALIATLPAEYGLYSSFVGVLIYCFFATSKDVSIGPVAVMSLTVAQVIKHVQARDPGQWDGPTIASLLALITGFIVLGIGLLRLGWLVEFISAPAVSGFMTGSAISIAAGQVPGLMGITGFDTRAATYKVIINTLKRLPITKIDAAFGITGLVSLYAIRYFCVYMSKKYPRRARLFFFISVLRNAFVIIVLTLAAWLYCRHRKTAAGKYPIKILQTVPPGFKHVKRPTIDDRLLAAMAPELPVATIILLLEHIAISKSFGRLNGYKIDPNQELIAIGVTNTIGSCFGAYPATGSFSRSALKSKSGVRTPAAGILTAIIVITALYGLTDAFFWIPSAGLSAIIIHAVADLVASPAQVYSYWRVSPLEWVIWVAAVLVTIFSSIENGIYTSIAASLVLLLIRVAHPRGSFLGKVTVRDSGSEDQATREVFLPLSKGGIVNSDIKVTPPSPGVLVYRFEESYLYPNSSIVNSALVDYVKENMRRGRDMSNVSLSERPWNDPGPSRRGAEDDQAENEKKPILHAIVLDFSTVSHLDTTATQALIDTRTEIEKWADHPVEFHFASVLSPWIRRALIAGGFGTGISASKTHDIAAVVPYRDGAEELPRFSKERDDVESLKNLKGRSSPSPSKDGYVDVISSDTPFFHIDLAGAVKAAESGLHRVL